ncbi:B-cell antigen receptor complex-associated protein alpha chain [Centropristis striata]|uniref:B-cell antigen receptor complex-associated protein alpha chain n=1 Tax=Centropristis striata TaxID=184440 RepID=UPI0027E143E2|nr:B-cell antigen receptor complex-associated protein alpha chain [Centropristis striata]
MGALTNFLLLSFFVGIVENRVTLEADKPYLRVRVFHTAELRCCYASQESVKITWIKQPANQTKGHHEVEASDRVTAGKEKSCGILTFKEVHLNDSGMYVCLLDDSKDPSVSSPVASHGTYLQVYKLMKKTINLRESTKNKILVAEGVILLLCVLVPSFTVLIKSKRLSQLEKKKAKKEEENIYQGLNLDECWSTYDQIERSQAHGPYEDVGNGKEEEEQIQLEKP